MFYLYTFIPILHKLIDLTAQFITHNLAVNVQIEDRVAQANVQLNVYIVCFQSHIKRGGIEHSNQSAAPIDIKGLIIVFG